VAEDGLQRLQVGVNVGDDSDAHSVYSISPAGSGLHSRLAAEADSLSIA
jgi:hypothetical protein